MRARSSYLGIVCAAGLGLAGCVGSRAPSGWLPDATGAAQTAYGGWIEVYFGGDQFKGDFVQGELLGFADNQLFILTYDSVAVIPVVRVERALLEGYDPKRAGMTLWTLAGTLSTISHGIALIISAPVWIIGGSAATASRSREGRFDMADVQLHRGIIARYARFPQGIPPGLDLNTLRTKPYDRQDEPSNRSFRARGQSQRSP